jgi:hypothetical protein
VARCAAARTRRRRQRPADNGLLGLRDIDRDTARASASRRHRRQRALRRLRPAHHLDDFHAVEPVPRHPRSRPRDPTRSSTRWLDLRAVGGRPGGQVPLSAIAKVDIGSSAPLQIASRAIPGDDGLVQPRARRFARRRGRRDREGREGHRLPASIRTTFQGAAQAFAASLERAVAAAGRVLDDVHRARRALRELHPPDHDPLDAAVGGHRRAAGADDVRGRTSTSSASSASSC